MLFSSERGFFAFYLGVILPFVLTLSILLVDVSSWQLLRERAQREADRIALQAAKLLPNIAAAENFVLNAADAMQGFRLARLPDGAPSVSLSNSELRLSLEANYVSNFDWILRSVGLPKLTFSLVESSRVGLVPLDVVLLVSDSSTLAPRPFEAWGESKLWPASIAFEQGRGCEFVFLELCSPLGESCLRNSREAVARWATQRCYNPVLSAVKLAAIELVSHFSLSPDNSLSLVFTSDSSSLRAHHYSTCFSLAQIESRYRMNSHQLQALSNSTTTAAYEKTCSSLSLPASQTDLSLEERVYYRAIDSEPLSEEVLVTSLSRALDRLEKVEPDSYRILRGGLSTRALRKVIVLAEVLPRVEQVQFAEVVQRAAELQVELLFVSFAHTGMSSAASGKLHKLGLEIASQYPEVAKVVFIDGANKIPLEILEKVLPLGHQLVIKS